MVLLLSYALFLPIKKTLHIHQKLKKHQHDPLFYNIYSWVNVVNHF